jgi:hypothetical protein
MQPQRIPATATMYNGTLMRSRFEAQFAQHLDNVINEPSTNNVFASDVVSWTYEPMAYGTTQGQYYPDFKVELLTGESVFVELKPQVFLTDDVFNRMHIIRGSEPDANLAVVTRGPNQTDSFYTWRACWSHRKCGAICGVTHPITSAPHRRWTLADPERSEWHRIWPEGWFKSSENDESQVWTSSHDEDDEAFTYAMCNPQLCYVIKDTYGLPAGIYTKSEIYAWRCGLDPFDEDQLDALLKADTHNGRLIKAIFAVSWHDILLPEWELFSFDRLNQTFTRKQGNDFAYLECYEQHCFPDVEKVVPEVDGIVLEGWWTFNKVQILAWMYGCEFDSHGLRQFLLTIENHLVQIKGLHYQ